MTRTLIAAALIAASIPGLAVAGDRLNILWISAEDISPDLGCYGDAYALTPNIDKLAGQDMRSTGHSASRASATSRSAIITGMYPTTISTHHMRCKAVPPTYVKCFPEYLRAAGYYCTNNYKTDYNFDAPVTAWDECSRKAHWRGRKDKDQPFFSVINIINTHESKIRAGEKHFADITRRLTADERHDPLEAVLPPYYPDTPIVRHDWAQYYDLITAMDKTVADILKQLEDDGLADNTVVFFFGDHGRGLPRAKRSWVYDSGMRVPLIVRWPKVIKPGSVDGRLVSFIDFGPTVLSIAEVKVPEHMQGRPFLGKQTGKPRDYVFAARDRMDETYDIIRAVRDKQYKYIRNFQACKPYAQYIGYMELMPTMQEMRRLNKAGELVGAERQYFLPEKPEEELYDVTKDPHEVNNLAGSAKYDAVLKRMRARLETWRKETHDLGLIPEEELNERMRPGGVWQTTATPVIRETSVPPGATTKKVAITCETEGTSIAYTTEAGDKPHWRLYTEPMTMDAGQRLRAKAIRLGYKESAEAKMTTDKTR